MKPIFCALIASAAFSACGGALAQSPKPRVEVIDLKWHLSGSIAILDTLTLSSFSDQGVKDIVIKCTTAGRSKTNLTEVKMTLYDKIEPKGVQYFTNVNLGPVNPQTAYLDCEVIATLPQ
jgi:hypothetical protein